MTITQFDNEVFKFTSRCIYDGKDEDILSVDFKEKLIGIQDPFSKKKIKWVRCENCKMI